jgi:hypothetical protein
MPTTKERGNKMETPGPDESYEAWIASKPTRIQRAERRRTELGRTGIASEFAGEEPATEATRIPDTLPIRRTLVSNEMRNILFAGGLRAQLHNAHHPDAA